MLILTVTANPDNIPIGGKSTVTINLLYDSAGAYHNPVNGLHVPDGISVTFQASKGIINPESDMVDGSAVSTFTANNSGIANITATVDKQTVPVKINISSKTLTNTIVIPGSGFAGQTVALIAKVTAKGDSVNEGQVRFTVNNVTAGTVNVSKGIVTLNWKIPSNWKDKTYSITANYLGTTNYMTSTNTSTLTVKPLANLAFNKTVTSGKHYYGDIIKYYLTVKNNGPDNATGVTVYDKLPTGLAFKSAIATIGSYKISNSTWTIGTLKTGQTAKLTITTIINKIGTINNTATLKQTTYLTTPIIKSNSFTVPAVVTIPQLITASTTIKTYCESHNYKLPSNLKVAGQTLNMPQILNVLVTATLNISKNNLKPVNVTAVGNPTQSVGNYMPGRIYNYVSTAQNIKTYINSQKKAPNYTQTTLGKIPFNKLVYMYAKIIDFYGQKNRLPNSVATYKI